MIFVFGSNLSGIHGAGAAKFALDHRGAIWGQGVGLQGRSYAIPTKSHSIKTLPRDTIKRYIWDFKSFAVQHEELVFQLTKVGCGLAGYVEEQIIPLFGSYLPGNVKVPPGWGYYFPDNEEWTWDEVAPT